MCDKAYTLKLREIFKKYLGNETTLFTTGRFT